MFMFGKELIFDYHLSDILAGKKNLCYTLALSTNTHNFDFGVGLVVINYYIPKSDILNSTFATQEKLEPKLESD